MQFFKICTLIVFEYASYGIKKCGDQFQTHNTMFLSDWCLKVCVRKLFTSTLYRQRFGVFSEFFWRFSDHFYTTHGTFRCTFLPLEISWSISDEKKLRELSECALESPESTLQPNIHPEFFRSFLEVFWPHLYYSWYFSIPRSFTIWNFKVIFVYEKTPKKLPKHFAAKYKLRTFKRTVSQVPHRLGSFYGAVSSTTISCWDLWDPKIFQKIQINSLKKLEIFQKFQENPISFKFWYKPLRQFSKCALESPESTLPPNIHPEFFRSFVEFFWPHLHHPRYFSLHIFIITNFKVTFGYEKTPKKLHQITHFKWFQ